jgi:hypothetical protein
MAATDSKESSMKAAFTLAFLSAFLLAPAHGGEIEIGTGLVCNTQKQVREYLAFNEAEPQTAVRAVNDEERDPTACGMANLAFVRGHNALTVRTKDATFQIADILVIGVVTDDGIESVAPSVQFFLFRIDERRA